MFNYICGPFPNFTFLGIKYKCKKLTEQQKEESMKESPFSYGAVDFPFCNQRNRLSNEIVYALFFEENTNWKTWEELFTICDGYYVDHRNNFTQEEQDFIQNMGINNLDDLLKAELSRTDRRLILEMYKYVLDTAIRKGYEPVDGFTYTKFGKYWFVIKIFSDRTIRFINKI